ncbi:TatD family hydrolase [Dokdonella sp.]|uniref:TatD family hydrolase n=1 Tax=Dokdonella sp. TaxID=2291710 RepID=UPI003C49F9D2
MLIDSHSHIDTEAFGTDRSEVLMRAASVGVHRQIVPAIARSGWKKLGELCADNPGLYPAFGLHPMFLAQHRVEHLDELAGLVEKRRPVAIGECGLDFFVDGLDRETQTMFFERQLELARDFDLPVVVHARRAFDAVAACIRRIGKLRGVIHSFSGSTQQAEAFYKLDFMLGIGGPATYPRAHRLRNLVAEMPGEFLLLETDSPDQPLSGHQGERNEPSRLRELLTVVAELRNTSEEQTALLTTTNAERLFKLPEFSQTQHPSAGR